MDDTSMRIKDFDVLTNTSIAVQVMLSLCQQRAPGAKIAPPKVCRIDKDFLRLLHDGIVDRDILAVYIALIHSLLFLVGAKNILKTLENIVYSGRIDAERVDDGLHIPNEDTRVPIVIVHSHILLGFL